VNIILETLDIPKPIKMKLMELKTSIDFIKRSRKGTNGWLFFGKNRISQQKVAIKFYDWGGDPTYHAEPQNLAKINSPNVIQILDASLIDNDYAYFLTPYYKNGDLDMEICNGIQGNFRAISVTRNILTGLSYLHSEKLLHRDLKPQNILIAQNGNAVIGDFGSVKKIPDGQSTVHGSGHSLIYTPPESISSGIYGITGDIYQVGLILYQMLGGHMPYELRAWLSKPQLNNYRDISDPIDRQIFGDNILKEKIKKGKIVDLETLPAWVCDPLRRIVSKACNIDSSKRFKSCSEFLAKLNAIGNKIHDWRIIDGLPIKFGKIKYKISFDESREKYIVLKAKGSSWRRDNSFKGNTIANLVHQIDQIS
jgi:serine/threonine protein kinase